MDENRWFIPDYSTLKKRQQQNLDVDVDEALDLMKKVCDQLNISHTQFQDLARFYRITCDLRNEFNSHI